MEPLIMRILGTSVTAATRAGTIIREIMSSGELGIVDKGVNDLQTQADRSAQYCIVSTLQKRFPGLAIIGEETLSKNESLPKGIVLGDDEPDKAVLNHRCPESLAKVSLEDLVVWVDPLDGTNEYTQGLLDHVTVLIGLSVLGKSVGGVIFQPYHNYEAPSEGRPGHNGTGRCVWGLEGLGGFGIETGSGDLLAAPELGVNNVITTTRSHGTGAVAQAIDACKPTQVLRVGGCGFKVLLLLERRAHAYVFASPGCKKWDTCAPEGILHACGGLLTDLHGNRLEYHASVDRPNRKGVLATAEAAWHPTYKGLIPEACLGELSG